MALFTTILGSAFLAAVANAAVTAIASFALSTLAQSLVKKPKADTQSLDFEQTVQRRLSNGQPLEVLVGQRIVAGVGFFDDAYSTKNERGVSISVVSAKPCSEFHRLFLDGEPVELSGDPTTGERSVTSHFLGKDDAERVMVRVFMGTNSNAGLGSYLATKFPASYTASDNHGDYCVIIVECRNTNDDIDEEEGTNYIPFQGFPEYKVEMTGGPVCDPRNAGEVYEDETTYTHVGGNAALVDAQCDFGWYSGVGAGRARVVGNGYPSALMDIDQIISNAGYCDLNGFTCSGIIRSGQTGDQEEVWKCYNADRVENSASVFSVPEGNRELVETIDMSDYPAAYVSNYDADGYSTEVYNEIRTVYSEPEEFYGEKDLPVYSRPEWIAADNHIPRQLALPLLFVTDKVQAGRLEKQEIVVSRFPSTCNIADLPFGFIRIAVGKLIRVVNSDVPAINDRLWVVKGRGQTSRGDVSFSLREYAGDDAFAFDAATETPEPTINPPVPRPWSEWWQPTDYVSPTVVSGILDGTQPLADVNITGVGSVSSQLDTNSMNIETAITAAASGGELSMTVPSNVSGVKSNGVDVTVTSDAITAIASGGVPGTGYTYLWEYVSGDVVVIDNPSSATTTFSEFLQDGESTSSVYSVTVTDQDTPAEMFSLNVNVSLLNIDFS